MIENVHRFGLSYLDIFVGLCVDKKFSQNPASSADATNRNTSILERDVDHQFLLLDRVDNLA